MKADPAQEHQHDDQKAGYTETLILIAGVEVLFFWTFLVSVGLFPGNASGPLAPVSTAIGFAIAGLGIVEFGIVVLNVQLAWILPDEHDESGVAPFLCGYCLLAQSLLMFPPLIIVAIIGVPLVLISVASVGWYFQKFSCLKLSKSDDDVFQKPLSLRDLLWMPVALLGLGVIPMSLLLFCGPHYFEIVLGDFGHFGVLIICSAIGMMSVSFVPLVLCYLILYVRRRDSVFQFWTFAVVTLFMVLGIAVESLASNFTSGFVPLVSLAIGMFSTGVWLGLRPWMKSGLQVVIAKPHPTVTEECMTFDEIL